MPPPVVASSPAMQLSAVDLPQPEGPRRAMNSPLRIDSVMSESALTVPKARLIRSSRSSWKGVDANCIGRPRRAGHGPCPKGRGHADLEGGALFGGGRHVLIPALEGGDHRRRFERQLDRVVGDPIRVLRATILGDRILAGF